MDINCSERFPTNISGADDLQHQDRGGDPDGVEQTGRNQEVHVEVTLVPSRAQLMHRLRPQMTHLAGF